MRYATENTSSLKHGVNGDSTNEVELSAKLLNVYSLKEQLFESNNQP
jgi:hypothetical protein